jgi:hypothetical protein
MNSRSNIAGLNYLKQAAEIAIRRTPKTQIGHQRGRVAGRFGLGIRGKCAAGSLTV